MTTLRKRRARFSPLHPDVVPYRAVVLAAHLLPAGERRDRYRAEFVADLYGLPKTRQLAYAAQVLTRAISLRHALNTAHQHTVEEVLPMRRPRPPLTCRLNLHHKWTENRPRTAFGSITAPDGKDRNQGGGAVMAG